MTDLHQKANKKDQQILFEVDLNYLSNQQGLLTSRTVRDTIHVATPREFGGEGNDWSPEHLFLASISSCFMTTYLFFAKKFQFSVAHFTCNITGQIGLVSGRYQFTRINILPKIFVADEGLIEIARMAVQKTQEYCLIAHSVSAEIIYQTEVLKGENHFADIQKEKIDSYANL